MDPAPRRRWRIRPNDHQAGQGLAEYALILSLIALVAITALAFFGSSVSGYLSMIGSSV
jgi:Flp pilus assembly pilin Flp